MWDDRSPEINLYKILSYYIIIMT
uniref:Uncharacterized protein n=1 Tax=Arundo donax TaxID=35708 RepID=A0A0A8YCM9_ARUDO